MPDTPLNPAALEKACKSLWESRGNYPRKWENVNPETAIFLRSKVIKYVSAYLTVAQPEVNSVEELEALPMHTYVQGNDGFKHAKDWNGGWHLIVNRPSSAPHLSGSIELPARVLYRPEMKP